MASYVKFESFVEKMAEKSFNLGSDTLKILLALSSPSASADAVKADLTDELGTGGGYTSGGSAVTITSSAQSGGTYSLVGTDLVFTATTGFGPFRYSVLYDDTATNDELISYWDYGSNVTLLASETFTVDFGSSIFTLA